MTTKEIDAIINRTNNRFNKASAAEKRVMIARDALKQIRNKRFEPYSGTYLTLKEGNDYFNQYSLEVDNTSSFQRLFVEQPTIHCKGCALAALFISTTILGNKSSIRDIVDEGRQVGSLVKDSDKLSNNFNQYFSRGQLLLIECAFECWEPLLRGVNYSFDKVVSFYEKCSNDETRLVAILKNIIKNKGTFKP